MLHYVISHYIPVSPQYYSLYKLFTLCHNRLYSSKLQYFTRYEHVTLFYNIPLYSSKPSIFLLPVINLINYVISRYNQVICNTLPVINMLHYDIIFLYIPIIHQYCSRYKPVTFCYILLDSSNPPI
jgi:hypothetical protein